MPDPHNQLAAERPVVHGVQPAATLTTAYVALGSNLGDRAATIARAVDLLRQTPGVEVTAVSSLIETAAVGGPPDAPPFLNGVAAVRTTVPPEALLAALLSIESGLGRTRARRWAPRTVDLDLLLYGSHVIATPTLTVPHPRLTQRLFVLHPLAEIAPAAVDPTTGRTAAELLRALSATPSIAG